MSETTKVDQSAVGRPAPTQRFAQEIGEFLQISMAPVTLAHWPVLNALLRQHSHSLTAYSATSLFAWQPVFSFHWARWDEAIVIALNKAGASDPMGAGCLLMQPVGPLTPPQLERLVALAQGWRERPWCMVGVEPAFVERHTHLAEEFEVVFDRNNCNYLYRASDLAQLAGHRYSKKRNLIAQAERAYSYEEEPLTADNAHLCLALNRTIRLQEGVAAGSQAEDDLALSRVVDNFAALELNGVLLRVDGEAVAFAISETQHLAPGAATATIHFERALRAYKGLYQLVNRAAARRLVQQGFVYINRQEDLGDLGLRQAKMSYHPLALLPALKLVKK